jgi:hypothetical protein
MTGSMISRGSNRLHHLPRRYRRLDPAGQRRQRRRVRDGDQCDGGSGADNGNGIAAAAAVAALAPYLSAAATAADSRTYDDAVSGRRIVVKRVFQRAAVGIAGAIDRDAGAGDAYITGETGSTTFPGVTAGSIQPANGGGTDAFVTKIGAAITAPTAAIPALDPRGVALLVLLLGGLGVFLLRR